MKSKVFLSLMFLSVSMFVCVPDTVAEDYTRWGLPDGATARPDGQTLASASDDGTILLWEVTHSTPTPLPEDVNADGAVNIQDLVLVASHFGETGENAADVNGDGIVNVQDLVAVAGAFEDAAAAPN